MGRCVLMQEREWGTSRDEGDFVKKSRAELGP